MYLSLSDHASFGHCYTKSLATSTIITSNDRPRNLISAKHARLHPAARLISVRVTLSSIPSGDIILYCGICPAAPVDF